MNDKILNYNGAEGFSFEKEFETLAKKYSLPIQRGDLGNLCNPD